MLLETTSEASSYVSVFCTFAWQTMVRALSKIEDGTTASNKNKDTDIHHACVSEQACSYDYSDDSLGIAGIIRSATLYCQLSTLPMVFF